MNISDIDNNFEKIEEKLLSDFFKFLEKYKDFFWVHWNMRDINYGFPALEHRFKALGGSPVYLSDEVKFDLPRILYERFGKKYAEHPRLENLVKQNNITDKNFLNGAQEAEAFKNHEYLKLHQSTLRKVDIFDCILSRIEEGDLKVKSNFFDIYGISLNSIGIFLQNHWFYSIASFVALVVTYYIWLKDSFK